MKHLELALLTVFMFTAKGTVLAQSDSTDLVTPLKSLDELCVQYKTDKCGNLNNYTEIYAKYFDPLREKTEKVFEIGILSGASHRLWKSYFNRAEIYGIDIRDCSYLENEGIHTYIADQSDRADLQTFINRYGGQFDIIIDDGGHTMEQQQVSLGFLFKHLKSGGLYVIEDVHTSLTKYYKGFGVNETGSNSTFNLIVQYMATGHINSEYLSLDEIDYLRLNIGFCEMVYIANNIHSMMCIIKKR